MTSDSDRGEAAVEFGLLVATIAAAILAVVAAAGTGLLDLFVQLTQAIPGA